MISFIVKIVIDWIIIIISLRRKGRKAAVRLQ